jgi:hypothetical protein
MKMKISPARVHERAAQETIEQAEEELNPPPITWARPVFVQVPLKWITARPDLFQVPDLDVQYVEDLAARIARNESIDPPLVMKIGGKWICVDGHHLIAAHRKLGSHGVRSEWFDGTVHEAADEDLRHLRRNNATEPPTQQGLSTESSAEKDGAKAARVRLLKALRYPLLSVVGAMSVQPGSSTTEDRTSLDTNVADVNSEDSSAPSASELRDELRYAPLANLRGRSESDHAKALVRHFAEQYPRGTGKNGSAKAYRQVKTLAAFELAIAAFLAELLAAHGDEWRGGWLRCSLDKDDRKSQAVTHSQFANVRKAWVAAGLVDEVKGYPGKFKFGNPGPGQGRMTRYKATPKLLGICVEHGVTPDNVSDHFWIEFEMPSELVQLTRPSRQTPTDARTTRLREEVAELNEFISQQVITPPTIRHMGWVRKFHMAHHPDFRWNKGGRLYSQPPVGSANYQNWPESERLYIEINGDLVVEIDIGSSYLTVFYGWHDVQLDPEEDAYRDIIGPSKLDREVAKFWVNASFGNSSLLSKWTKETLAEFKKKLVRKGLDPREFNQRAYPMKLIREKVLNRHPLLKDWGREPIRGRLRDWSDLMFSESEAIIRTMLILKRQHGIPSLPVYDAIIVPMTKQKLAREVLTEQFRIETGVAPRLDANSLWDF